MLSPMRQTPITARTLLILGIVLLLCGTIYTSELIPNIFTPSYRPIYLSASSGSEQICAQGATYLDPRELIDTVPSPADSPYPTHHSDPGQTGRGPVAESTGFPKFIHQSWTDTDLPVRFSQWSDSLRLRHPDWTWVLWTDDDNAHLISTRHPHLNASYWALRNNIQRADFMRNIYMWDFGGVYADLDMECLRPLDSLLSPPFAPDILSPTYPMRSDPTPDHAIAYAGSMDTQPHERNNAIPNAFLASSRRHHPFWLLPISRALTHLHAGADGTGVRVDQSGNAEDVTGPRALLRSVETYRSQRDEGDNLGEAIHPILEGMLDRSERKHEVVIFDSGVIYPFSWSTTEHSSRVYQACRAASGYSFDSVKCQDACRAYERGARMITYWSHTWSQTDDSKDLEVVGAER